ncbi:hypothetical protein HOG17_04000 [Candidatus Peregrinibacteria bacterium]|nr:hypothetical protein [Candidatus Peregrinibacteria bacterium]MBT4148365.1 hypothetical protein [Candidatus Peregrinibacteria bacterium]MBT4366668.1 hypothetical protein [Candidatus Peregrinibacteria bacterium]MBT4455882.1 hypothetical protein [Candidatus Peregrinibacteria bacterium]
MTKTTPKQPDTDTDNLFDFEEHEFPVPTDRENSSTRPNPAVITKRRRAIRKGAARAFKKGLRN